MAKQEKIPTLFQAATTGGRVIKQGHLVQFIIDGAGAMLTTTLDFYAAEKWGQSKFGSGNRMADRNRFLEQIPTLVARPGSFVGTRGSTKTLEDLCKLMLAGGYDLNEWGLPPELKAMGHPKKPTQPGKKPDAAAGAGSSEASESSLES